MQNLKTILGYYDFGDTPKTIVYPIETDYSTTVAHEFAHKTLNDRSVLGVNIKLFKSLVENAPEQFKPHLQNVVNLLIKETEFVQEGFACYKEYQAFKAISKEKNNVDSFINTLSIEGHYRSAFKIATLIEEIFKEEDIFDGLNKNKISNYRAWILTDISRFSLNIPFKHIFSDYDINELANEVEELLIKYNPTKRWNFILNSLSNDEKKRKDFHNSIKNMLLIWEQKHENEIDESNQYNGIKYADNIEQQISDLFPNLIYSKLVDEAEILPQKHENNIEYALKEINNELLFLPFFPLSPLVAFNKNNFVTLIENYNNSESEGCHLKIFLNNTKSTRILNWINFQETISIQPYDCLILVHHARFRNTTSGRVWDYDPFFSYFFIKTDEVNSVLEHIKSDDINVCVDFSLDSIENHLFIQKLTNLKFPIYLFPEPRGTLKSLLEITSQPYFPGITFDIHFFPVNPVFAKNDSLIVSWIIPNYKNKNLVYLSFYDKLSCISIINLYKKNVKLPFNIILKKGKYYIDVYFNDEKHGRKTEVFWQFDPENEDVLLCPYNGEEVYGHILDFGI